MDENNELHVFEGTGNIFDSEEQLKATFGSGYKEYDFEPDGSTQQLQEIEHKVQDLWRTIEKTGIVPHGPDPKSIDEARKPSASKKPRSWLEAWKELSDRGMDKEARFAKLRSCKLCDGADVGKIFADEAYQDRYIKPFKPDALYDD